MQNIQSFKELWDLQRSRTVTRLGVGVGKLSTETESEYLEDRFNKDVRADIMNNYTEAIYNNMFQELKKNMTIMIRKS